jgi:hypothetical protein
MTVVAARSARSTCARILRAPFTRRAWANLGYSIMNVPLAIVGVVVTIGTLAHPLLIPVSTFGARGMGAASRGLARRMLGERVPPPAPLRTEPGVIGWLQSTLSDAPGGGHAATCC